MSLAVLPWVAGCSYLPSWAGGPEKKIERVAGERIAVLQTADSLQPDTSLAAVAPEIPGPAANDSWPGHGGNAQAHIGHVALPKNVSRAQSARVGEGEAFPYHLVITPVVAEGRVFAMDANGVISAHAAADVSDVQWVSPGVAAADEEPVMGGGLAYEKGVLYAASGRGLVAAFNAKTGVEIWRQALNIPIRSAPRAEAGRVYVVTVDSQLYALDAKTGGVVWSHRGVNEGRGFLIEATPAADGEMVVAPYSSGEVHVLHADDGAEVWSDVVMGPQRQSALSVFSGIGGDPVLADGLLYVAGSAGMFAVFQAESGRRLWDQPVSSLSTPWVAGDLVFVLATDGRLIAFQRLDGRVRWVHALPQPEGKGHDTWSGPVLAGGRLLVAGAHGIMQEIAVADGALLAETAIPEGVYAAPVVANNVAYVISDDATLHALR